MSRFLFIEPFYGGSHKYFADGLIQKSCHEIDLYSLPARFWKWRMRGASVYAVQHIKDLMRYEAIIVSNMLSVSDFKALAGPDLPPVILYFHENQILYPLAEGETEDLHYGFTDFISALCADSIIFNSEFHMKAFLKGIPPFLSRFPDFRPSSSIEKIQTKCQVIPPGCHLDPEPYIPVERPENPVIIWNHRWEHDKNPEDFFEVLFELDSEGIPFSLAVLGERYTTSPEIFSIAEQKLKDRIIHFGYAENYSDYKAILNSGNIVISTAFQENFGISIIEAIGSGNFPLLPNRLSYKEIIPEEFHKFCLYKNKKDLINKLKKLISHYDPQLLRKLVEKNKRYDWNQIIAQYDLYLEQKKNPVNRDFYQDLSI
ncbi:tRNA-queuosine alpha-mannosyltransferase domain-containing protein [Spirochaeta isovalerica]|uniref:tRNA-queuosine alpha-mannosyltransferase n=1 Tax=Spirochaeta isovalerica TaxID=150 RepID=A0A841R955_9SPIO|nr:DUF3524 domain-containing protein [Spirochaeta isovalerica]MBB6479002.1 glycosyltransferase involved in cell wall biosynthesis [Spirochaeta isovalerica]